jgi:hypothetical protein
MSNMLATIVPKTDQLNADLLIGGPITIKIDKISIGTGDQPVILGYEGDNGKPYKPCKSMRRVLVTVWGDDGNAYVGRSLTLYCDIKVTFGGAAVGGVRISHMSHLKEEKTILLTASKANKKPFTVKPLSVRGAVAKEPHPDVIKQGEGAARKGVGDYTEWLSKLAPEVKETVRGKHKAWTALAQEADKTLTTDGYPADTGEGDPE